MFKKYKYKGLRNWLGSEDKKGQSSSYADSFCNNIKNRP